MFLIILILNYFNSFSVCQEWHLKSEPMGRAQRICSFLALPLVNVKCDVPLKISVTCLKNCKNDFVYYDSISSSRSFWRQLWCHHCGSPKVKTPDVNCVSLCCQYQLQYSTHDRQCVICFMQCADETHLPIYIQLMNVKKSTAF